MCADSKLTVESMKQAIREEFERHLASNKPKADIEAAKLLADHIKNTYKVVTDFWKERNRIFIYLIITVAIALLLSTTVEGTQTVITYLFSYIAKVTGAPSSDNQTIPVSATLVRAAIPLPIFYLVFNLYQREVFLRRNYFYIDEIEKQIREKCPEIGRHAFTREGNFYKKSGTVAQGIARHFYYWILFVLLGLFFFHIVLLLILG